MQELDPIKQDLIANHDEFRRLYEEHQGCKLELDTIRQKSLPSEEDELEMKRIKLHKLSLKDQMEQILHQHTAQAVTA